MINSHLMITFQYFLTQAAYLGIWWFLFGFCHLVWQPVLWFSIKTELLLEQIVTFPNSKLVFSHLDKCLYIVFANCVHIRLSKVIHYTVRRTEAKGCKHRRQNLLPSSKTSLQWLVHIHTHHSGPHTTSSKYSYPTLNIHLSEFTKNISVYLFPCSWPLPWAYTSKGVPIAALVISGVLLTCPSACKNNKNIP